MRGSPFLIQAIFSRSVKKIKKSNKTKKAPEGGINEKLIQKTLLCGADKSACHSMEANHAKKKLQ